MREEQTYKEFRKEKEDMQNDYLEEYPAVITASEVMDILGIGKNLVYEMLNSGELPGVRIGKSWRITKKSLLNFLNL